MKTKNLVENTIACYIKSDLLYGDKTKITYEFPAGDTLEAEIGDTTYYGEDWINLIIRYRTSDNAQTSEMVLEWFPDDEDLLEAISDILKGRAA